MDADPPQRLRARMEDLQLARALAEAVCARQGVAAGDTLRLVLVLEELFTNTVMHGHRRECDAPVLIGLQASETHLHLRYADDAPPFDPLHYLKTAASEPESEPERERLGGWGLRLVAEMAERFDYAHVGGFNHLTLALKRAG
ncbi:MAG: ATP-binding protein [Burkholderiaceae bacterium]|jgi:anti-sigma regulatory factor (Ser/Thr protein kinase)|nr:ATP-binding protein [Burkholderiaceae bacterium]